MPQARLSVIIPTYNRAPILAKTLEAYKHQTRQQQLVEILVVDDGSTDGTGSLVSECARQSSTLVRYLRQENRGQASARNYGIREASGDLVLLGDDDVIPAPNMVEEHLSWHDKHPDPKIAVVGAVPWSPEVNPRPVMKWWGLNGLHPDGHEVYWPAGLLLNTSLKRAFLQSNGLFDERFRHYGYEDIELCYRLAKKGLRMLYNPCCVGYHYKRVTFDAMCRRGWTLATTPSLKIFERTEAGKEYLANDARRRNSWKYRLQYLLARLVVPLLAPLRPLLDSRVPLPGAVYAMFYAYYGSYRARERKLKLAHKEHAG